MRAALAITRAQEQPFDYCLSLLLGLRFKEALETLGQLRKKHRCKTPATKNSVHSSVFFHVFSVYRALSSTNLHVSCYINTFLCILGLGSHTETSWSALSKYSGRHCARHVFEKRKHAWFICAPGLFEVKLRHDATITDNQILSWTAGLR